MNNPIFKTAVFLLLFTGKTVLATSQTETTPIEGKKVFPVEIRDVHNQPLLTPRLGEVNLLIFYVDPDHYRQNKKFIDYLTAHSILCDSIDSYGIVNLKDAPLLPNKIVRSIMRRKSQATGGVIYIDPNHAVRDAWGLGDVNNKFILIFINRDRTIEFYRYGEFTEKDKTDFFRVVDRHREKTPDPENAVRP